MAERLQPVCEANNGRDKGKKSSSNVSLDGRKSCFNMAKCVTQRDYTKSTFKTCWYIDFLLLIKRHFKSILGSMVFYHVVGWGVSKSKGKKNHSDFLENQFFLKKIPREKTVPFKHKSTAFCDPLRGGITPQRIYFINEIFPGFPLERS